jgi:hypothetical protein
MALVNVAAASVVFALCSRRREVLRNILDRFP